MQVMILVQEKTGKIASSAIWTARIGQDRLRQISTHLVATAVAGAGGLRNQDASSAVDGAEDGAGNSAARDCVAENGRNAGFECHLWVSCVRAPCN